MREIPTRTQAMWWVGTLAVAVVMWLAILWAIGEVVARL